MKKITRIFLRFVMMCGTFFCIDVHAQKDMKIGVVDRPDVQAVNTNYVQNKAPLLPLNCIKLPVGDVKPQGWLLEMLYRQKMD